MPIETRPFLLALPGIWWQFSRVPSAHDGGWGCVDPRGAGQMGREDAGETIIQSRYQAIQSI